VAALTTFDYILLGILLLSALAGVLRGLIREALSLAIWVGALWSAARFAPELAPQFARWLGDPALQLWAARAALFVGVMFAGNLIAWLVGYLVRRSAITGTDRMLGFLFGAARGALLAGLVVLALELGGFAGEPWWRESKLLPYAAEISAQLRAVANQQLAGQSASPETEV
jgi:membrane protein required for colicin V production